MIINMIGVPLFYGSDRKGVDCAPDKLRENRIIDIIHNDHHEIYDCGNMFVPNVNEGNKYSFNSKMKYLKPIIDVNTNLAHEVYSSFTSGSFPFVVGGDHSLGLGSISGASKYHKNLAVIWVDAHGDINTDKTTNSGNVHGMPLAAAMGIGPSILTDLYFKGRKVEPENVFIIGARDLDKGESTLVEEKRISLYSTEDIKNKGIEFILEEIHHKLIENGVDAVHLSFDIDCLDPSMVPGTGTPVLNGMSIEDAKFLLKYLMSTKLIKSMDLVELNTLLDKNDSTTKLVIDLVDWTFKNMH
ncbi:arginase [Clostridium sp.]|uniref:arginase n=1 Tax=Clostridium sp. TaxID=1506 RepID=UPI002590F1CD|nr:arginase [Clostridium sp.]MDF2504406.1 arginase [Clostridium sp.]